MGLVTVEEDIATNTAERITIRNILALVGSVGEESLVMSKAKEDERLASSIVVVAKKDQAKENVDNKIHHRHRHHRLRYPKVTRVIGPTELLHLKVDERHTLLVNFEPQGSIPKLR